MLINPRSNSNNAFVAHMFEKVIWFVIFAGRTLPLFYKVRFRTPELLNNHYCRYLQSWVIFMRMYLSLTTFTTAGYFSSHPHPPDIHPAGNLLSLNYVLGNEQVNSTVMGRVAGVQEKVVDGIKRPLCNPPCCKYILTTASLILLYFSLSIGLTFYQRWLLQRLKFPLFITMGHLFLKFLTALLLRTCYECITKKQRITLDWYNYCTRVAPVGLASGFDVAFSNWGLELITVSLYTMTKSTAVIFILIFSLIFKLEKKSWRIVIIVLMISGGLIMFTYKSTQFNLIGFILVLLATFSSGLRWTLAQLLMQKSKVGLSNPLDMLYHVQPWMFLMVLPFAISFEGLAVASSSKFFNFTNIKEVGHSILTIIIGAFIAFSMEMAEYLLVSCTSSLTLSIVGIFKEVCTLVLAVEWNGDQISEINVLGLLLCLGGISFHVALKAIAASDSVPDSSDGDQEIPFIAGEGQELRMPLLAEESSFSNSIILNDSDSDDNSEVLFSVLQSRDNATYETEDR